MLNLFYRYKNLEVQTLSKMDIWMKNYNFSYFVVIIQKLLTVWTLKC